MVWRWKWCEKKVWVERLNISSFRLKNSIPGWLDFTVFMRFGLMHVSIHIYIYICTNTQFHHIFSRSLARSFFLSFSYHSISHFSVIYNIELAKFWKVENSTKSFTYIKKLMRLALAHSFLNLIVGSITLFHRKFFPHDMHFYQNILEPPKTYPDPHTVKYTHAYI